MHYSLAWIEAYKLHCLAGRITLTFIKIPVPRFYQAWINLVSLPQTNQLDYLGAMRNPVKAILALVFLSLQAEGNPNIILCMADDMGWGDTGYNGHPYLKTPNLDRMAAEGITFTRFYSAAAMCSPTRGSVYTGRNPYRYGITYAMRGKLEESEIPITTVLKRQGYTTGHFGKWHMGTLSKIKGDQTRWGAYGEDPEKYYSPPWERDVDVCFVTESKVPTWDPMVHPEPVPGGKVPKNPPVPGSKYGNEYFYGPGQVETEDLEGDDSRVIMDRAIPFIRQAVTSNQPFLAVIWFHAPHSPVVGGEAYRALYPDQPIHEQHFYACITAMDEQVGRLREELDSLGIAGNTMLWFCSDNGPARQGDVTHVGTARELSGYKLSINEGGIRVPGLLVWPDRIKQPRTVDTPCFTSDYFPTLLDVLDVPLPGDRAYDGISLLPVINGTMHLRPKPMGFLNRDAKEHAWIDNDYKLLLTNKGGEQLYNISRDPSEKDNLIGKQPERHAAMRRELEAWKAEVLAELDSIK